MIIFSTPGTVIAGIQQDEVKEVLVFKTNIRFKKDVLKLTPLLNNQPGIIRWNIDRADIDKVIRIESRAIAAPEIIALIRAAGYQCDELPD